jgi:hypothetical protein
MRRLSVHLRYWQRLQLGFACLAQADLAALLSCDGVCKLFASSCAIIAEK